MVRVKVYFPRRVVVVVLRFLPAPVVVDIVVLPSFILVVVRIPLLVERIVVLPFVILIRTPPTPTVYLVRLARLHLLAQPGVAFSQRRTCLVVNF